MATALHTFIQFVIVVLLLVGMVVLLLSIHHVTRGEGSASELNDLEKLKAEVEDEPEVISTHSLFHRFLVRPLPGQRLKKVAAARPRRNA